MLILRAAADRCDRRHYGIYAGNVRGRGALAGTEDLALDYLETVQRQERTLAGC